MTTDEDPSEVPFIVVRTAEMMHHPLVNRWVARDEVTVRGRDILIFTSGPQRRLQAIARASDRVENDEDGETAQVYDIRWAKITTQTPPL